MSTNGLAKAIRMVQRWRKHRPGRSYSQCGEDRVLDYLLSNLLKLPEPYYLDIGAHHPVTLNNTYLFYQRGCRGVCVEPNSTFAAAHRKLRPRDTLLTVGVAAAGEAAYFRMSVDTLNTFSREEADRFVEEGHSILEETRLPVKAIGSVLEQDCERCPDLVSLDIEGGELELLEAWDFSKHRPAAFCIETLTYSRTGRGEKVQAVLDLMEAQNYRVFADTYINTIFVDVAVWDARPDVDPASRGGQP